MNYDHQLKAGNEGDCVKHPAFVAGLNFAIASRTCDKNNPFFYLDAFAGQAWHCLSDDVKPVLSGVGGEYVWGNGKVFSWRDGIGEFIRRIAILGVTVSDTSVNRWAKFLPSVLPPGHSVPVPFWYPGSAAIAEQLCPEDSEFWLFDISQQARRSLEELILRPAKVKVGHCVNFKNPIHDIDKPDFVFLDPPGFWSEKNDTYPKFEDLINNVFVPRSGKPTLLWAPHGGRDPKKSSKGDNPWGPLSRGVCWKRLELARQRGIEWTVIRWGPTVWDGCVLFHNFAHDQIRRAVAEIVRVFGGSWEGRKYDPVFWADKL